MTALQRRWNGHLALLLTVVVVALVLRLYALDRVPSELIADEIDLYNSARSIATTGHDVDGTLLPYFYASFTRNPPVYGIAAYASSLIFGKNAWGLRLPAALFGVVSVLLVYGIALELTRRRDAALAAAALIATEPIFVQFSRIAWEPASELPFLLGGLYVAVRALRRADATPGAPLPLAPLLAASALLGIAAYTYMAGWFYAVVLGGALLALNARRLENRTTRWNVLGAAGLWLVVAGPALWMLFADPSTAGRTQRIATFSGGVSWAAIATFFQNYAKQFDWGFLATTGDPIPGATWRYLTGFGAFFWWSLPLAALGVLALGRLVPARWARRWLWIWLLAYPLGGALTNEAIPNAPRTLAGAPVFAILAGIGAVAIVDAARRHTRVGAALLQIGFACGIVVSTVLFARFYFTDFVHVYPNAWDSGTRALFSTIRADAPRYARVCFLVYPAFYAIDTYERFYLDGVPIEQINDVDSPSCFAPGTLVATDGGNRIERAGFVPVATIRDVNGNVFAWVIGRPSTDEHLPKPAPP